MCIFLVGYPCQDSQLGSYNLREGEGFRGLGLNLFCCSDAQALTVSPSYAVECCTDPEKAGQVQGLL